MKRHQEQSKAQKTNRSRQSTRRGNRIPRTAEEYFAMSERSQDRWTRATHVIAKMRKDQSSLVEASREYRMTPRAVRGLAKSALRKRPNGRFAARSIDHLLRVLLIPTSSGLQEIAVRDSRQATLLGEYWAAVQRYLETGEATALRKFRRKTITDANGKRIRLIKDLAELDKLGSAGVLSFESIYRRAA
jgi:hypothetical protein